MKIFNVTKLAIILSLIILQNLYATASNEELTAQGYFDKGVKMQYSGQHVKALDLYNSAIKLHPNFAEAYFNKGFALDNLGEHQ